MVCDVRYSGGYPAAIGGGLVDREGLGRRQRSAGANSVALCCVCACMRLPKAGVSCVCVCSGDVNTLRERSCSAMPC
jgi:hypothetical protein